MSVEQVTNRTEQVANIIQRAAQNNQQDFNYMLAQARVESGLNPDAKAKTSSAAGLYQFTSGTWIGLVKRHGDKVGLEDSARSLRNGAMTPSEKTQLLEKRFDPGLSSELAARFAIENARSLQRSGHENVGSAELYMAHFLGAQGANTFLTGLKTSPNAPAATALPEAANANNQVFYSNGKARSYADIFAQFQKRFGEAGNAERSLSKAVKPADAIFAKPALAPVIAGKAGQAVQQTARVPEQPLPDAANITLKADGAAMSDPAIRSVDDAPSQKAAEVIAAKALQQESQQANGQQGDLSLDEASLGSFLRGFTFQQADPGLTPVINDAETRDASRGAGVESRRDLFFGADAQLSGQAIGGRLIVRAADRDSGTREAKAEEARRPAPAPSGKAGFTDWASLWGGASKASTQRTP